MRLTKRVRRLMAEERRWTLEALPIGGRRFRARIFDRKALRPVWECSHEHKTTFAAIDCALDRVPRVATSTYREVSDGF